ncbi:response regulator [Deltaproteobacteria bacterium TL4]
MSDPKDGYRCLVVDDEPFVREAIVRVMNTNKAYYHVDTATDGQDALDQYNEALVANRAFDLMVVDLKMPRMDGRTLIEEIRKKDDDIAFIILTGHGSLSEGFGLLKSYQISDFLSKPLEHPRVLLFALENALEKRRLRQQNQIHIKELKALNDLVSHKNNELEKTIQLQRVTANELLEAKTQLEKINAQLEQRVLERTNELQLKNQLLEQEIEKRALLMTAIESAVESIFITNAQGMIQYANPSMVPLTGYALEEILGHAPNLFKSGKHANSVYRELWDTISSGHVWIGKLTNIKKDGTSYTIEQTISPIIDKSGNISNYVAVAHDITEKQKFEKQLRQAQKVEALGTLAGGIAHDFNNILTSILGYTDLSLEVLPKDHEAVDFLECVKNSGTRATELVKQILMFSRSEDREFAAVSIIPVIKEALKMLRATLPVSIEIVPEIEENIPLIMADPTQIHQIIINLCTNAFHAMEVTGGILKISLCQLSQQKRSTLPLELSSKSFIELRISDTGCGMAPEVLEHIFEPFFTTKEVGKGTGLGLSVVHGIVSAHKGTITVESEENQGTSFTILIPIAEKASTPKNEKIQIRNGTERILIIDDEFQIVNFYEIALKKLGYQVTTTTSSETALELFSKAPDQFDLVFTDLTMPQMKGDQLSQKILQIRKDIPIILASGFSYSFSKERAQQLGIRKYLSKPVAIHEFTTILREIFD